MTETRMRTGRLLAAGCLAAVLAGTAGAGEPPKNGGPYVPTPQVVVDQMLRTGGVGPQDFVIDLGSGDGVIVRTAARQLKARGLGVDIDADLVAKSNAAARAEGIADLATFEQRDVFKQDIGKASVLTLYLLPQMTLALRPKILKELKPGARIVSHDYHFEEWLPDNTVVLDVPEKEFINGVPKATIYLWIVPADASGRWQVRVADGKPSYDVTIRQHFQRLNASATADKRSVKVLDASLRGEEIAFSIPTGGPKDEAVDRFRGRVVGDRMEGMIEKAGMKGVLRWTATRVAPGSGIMPAQ